MDDCTRPRLRQMLTSSELCICVFCFCVMIQARQVPQHLHKDYRTLPSLINVLDAVFNYLKKNLGKVSVWHYDGPTKNNVLFIWNPSLGLKYPSINFTLFEEWNMYEMLYCFAAVNTDLCQSKPTFWIYTLESLNLTHAIRIKYKHGFGMYDARDGQNII